MKTDKVIDILRKEYKRLNYAFFEGEDFDLNLFGVRNPAGENLFDDLFGCAWKEEGEWNLRLWPGTTDPGSYYLRDPMNRKGTAILAAGQNRSMWELGRHRDKYEALVQTGSKVHVYRDVTRDDEMTFDLDRLDTGYFGINHHHAGLHSEHVDKWSAGCQVHKTRSGFADAMRLAKLQQLYHPHWTKYTYTLFTLAHEPTADASPVLASFLDLSQDWTIYSI